MMPSLMQCDNNLRKGIMLMLAKNLPSKSLSNLYPVAGAKHQAKGRFQQVFAFFNLHCFIACVINLINLLY